MWKCKRCGKDIGAIYEGTTINIDNRGYINGVYYAGDVRLTAFYCDFCRVTFDDDVSINNIADWVEGADSDFMIEQKRLKALIEKKKLKREKVANGKRT